MISQEREECRNKFSRRLRALMQERQLTQIAIADMAKVDPCQVCGWYNGKRLPSIWSVIRLAKALGVTTDYILGVTEDE